MILNRFVFITKNETILHHIQNKCRNKKALEKLSKKGYLSLSAQVEMIIVKYLEAEGICLVEERNNKGTK